MEQKIELTNWVELYSKQPYSKEYNMLLQGFVKRFVILYNLPRE
jgi:hypothetical protein